MRWLLLLLIIATSGCKKDTHYDPYYINYREGQEYELTFYISNIRQTGTPPNDYSSLTLTSIDRRFVISGLSSDSPLAPRNLTKPNLEETDDLKLYQVADFRFVFDFKTPAEEGYTKTKDWRWVYGRIKDYKFPNGSVYQRIEIVREI